MHSLRHSHRIWFNNYSKYYTSINKSLKNNNTKNKEQKFILPINKLIGVCETTHTTHYSKNVIIDGIDMSI